MSEDFAILMVFFAISATLNVALGIGWIRGSLRLRRLERRLSPPPPDDRSEQLERTVEQLAAQVEQLHSGQEFLNRVLTDRIERLAPPAPGRFAPEDTPR